MINYFIILNLKKGTLMKNKTIYLFFNSDKKVIGEDKNNTNSISYVYVSWIMIQIIILSN